MSGHIPDLEPHCGSWIVSRADTGEVVGEFFDRARIARFDAAKVRVQTAAQYLGELNAKIKAAAVPVLAGALIMATLPASAHADPCRAPVTGYQPGDVVRGRVVYAVDGDSLCLDLGHRRWLEIREARWFAPELSTYAGFRARQVMRQQVGRAAVCTVARGFKGQTFSYDRVIASCRIDGQPVAQLMRAAGVKPGGRGW